MSSIKSTSAVRRYWKWSAATIAAAIVAAACGGGGDAPTGGVGTLRLAITDAPACGFDEVNVTIEKVRVHKSSAAADQDSGWSEVPVNPPKRLDLLTLTNGVLAELGQAPLPAGKYTQMRLVLSANEPGAPPANSVVLSATGAERALTTPSGQQTGLKTNVNIDVAANETADFVIDFDACRSVVTASASGQHLLKPVLSVIPRQLSGVAGHLQPDLANGSTLVSLQQSGDVVKATVPDANGRFLLQPVAPGTYDLVIAAPGRQTMVVTGVPVSSDAVTPLNGDAARIGASLSGTGIAAGKVTTAATPVEASVRVLQAIDPQRNIEIVSGHVDGSTSSYSFALPTAAPLVAPYAAPPAALGFSAYSEAAAKYRVQAISGGTAKTSAVLTVPAGGTANSDLAFP